MFAKHRSFIVFALLAIALGVLFAAVWMLATGEYRPPLWVTVAAAIGTGFIADALERSLNRRHARRQRTHVEGPRPTNADGTPYGFHQLRAEGWEHCDGCRVWGQGWTADNPHRCSQKHVKGPVSGETV